jgi:pimeloyl-ACP methyl ester carboxylesterase
VAWWDESSWCCWRFASVWSWRGRETPRLTCRSSTAAPTDTRTSTRPAIGIYGVGDIPSSAQELAAFVDQVLAATGAGEVDLVGHSQGGMMPRNYLKYLGGAAEVHTLVGLSPSNHGTTLDGLFTLSSFLPGASQFTGAFCPACQQQEAGSAFITDLNSGG